MSSEFFSVAGAIQSAEDQLAEYSEKDNENFDVRMGRVNSRVISVFLITETDLKISSKSAGYLEEAREVSLLIDKFNMAQVNPENPGFVTVLVSRNNINKITEFLLGEEIMMARRVVEEAVLELESGFVAAGGERNNLLLEMLEIRRKQSKG